MKIQRNVNGQVMEFELTPEELYAAHREQEHACDKQDIEDALEGYCCKGGDSDFFTAYEVPFDKVYKNESLISEMAYEKRRNMDKYDMSWDTARDEAISEIIDRHREELCAEQILTVTPDKVSPNLPERCFGVLPGTGDLILIQRGESGYYKTDWSTSNPEDNRALAEENNAALGVNKAQAAAMLAGSMFGWHVPAAQPEMYDENGEIKRDSLSDQISAAEREQNTVANAEVDMSYGELRSLFRSVERSGRGHVSAHVVFTEDSFTQPYSEESRTYIFSSDNKAFQPNMGGYSIYGSCLDGSDPCLRLEGYMAAEKGGKDGWKIERCYMAKEEFDKANAFIDNFINSYRYSEPGEER